MLRRLLRFEVVPNSGSTARDALATERTFLAWLRTAVTAISTGVVLSGFDSTRLGVTASVLFVILGLLCLLYCTPRYYYTLSLLRSGSFAPDSIGPVVVGMLTLVTGCVALAFILQ